MKRKVKYNRVGVLTACLLALVLICNNLLACAEFVSAEAPTEQSETVWMEEAAGADLQAQVIPDDSAASKDDLDRTDRSVIEEAGPPGNCSASEGSDSGEAVKLPTDNVDPEETASDGEPELPGDSSDPEETVSGSETELQTDSSDPGVSDRGESPEDGADSEASVPTVEVELPQAVLEDELLLTLPEMLEEEIAGEHISEDANFIRIQKTFSGISEDQIPSDFAIAVNGPRGRYRLTKQGVEGAGGSVSRSSDGLTWRWKIIGANTGNYTVSEQNAKIEGYTLSASGDLAEITVEPVQIENLSLDIYTTCSHLDWSVNGSRFFAATLTSKNGSVVISERPLSASERARISAAIKAREKGTWKEPVHYYSFQDKGLAAGEMISIVGDVLLSYNASEGKIYLNRTSDWQHVISGSYDMRAPASPEIEIENKYRRNAVPLTITKRVEGNMADRTRAFSFELSAEMWTDGTQKRISEEFQLRDGESKTFDQIIPGSEIVISETESGYAVRVESAADGILNGSSYTISHIPEAGAAVTFVNTKNAVIDTGITRDSLPYLTLLLIACVAVVLQFAHRRGN